MLERDNGKRADPNNEVRVLREPEFIKELGRRPNEPYWQRVEII